MHSYQCSLIMGEWWNWIYTQVLGTCAERRVGSNPTSPTIFSGRKYLGSRNPIYLVVMNAYRKASDGKYTNTVCYPDVKVRIGSI